MMLPRMYMSFSRQGIQEWAEASISSGVDDSVSMFFEGASSEDEPESASALEGLFHAAKSREELGKSLERAWKGAEEGVEERFEAL